MLWIYGHYKYSNSSGVTVNDISVQTCQTSRFANAYGIKITNMSNFHALEVVGRVSETQLQAGDILNYCIGI